MWSPGPLRISPGLRLAVDSMGEPALLEPRLAVSWKVGPQTALELAGGRYHQAPETEHLIPRTGDPDLPTTRSWQLAGGLQQTVANRVEVEVDAYGKWSQDALFFPVDGPAEVAGASRAWGVEVLTRYRLRDHFFLWGWVAVARTTVVTSEGLRPADGDQPFVGGVVASWDFAEHWNLGLRDRAGSGLPYTSVREGLYDATLDRWLPIPADENGARLPFYQKIDLHLERDFAFREWTLTLTADLWYVPKPSAQLYPTWSYDWSEQGWVVGPTLLPLLGARARF
jgi:hypothetical protein